MTSENSRENYQRKCFLNLVKFNPRLSANWPSNNWAQVLIFMMKYIYLFPLAALLLVGARTMESKRKGNTDKA